jgi:hypothetical protein
MQRVCLQLIIWWLDYIENPEPNCPSWNKMFWQRFRWPYLSYPQILEWVSGNGCDGLFNRWWTEADGFTGRKNNKEVPPLEHFLFGRLPYLGRGWTFDDIKEATKARCELHRCFFHAFTTFSARFVYPWFVHMPHTITDSQNCESVHAMAGFPRCIGSTDATHIPLDNKVTASFLQAYLGYKMGIDRHSLHSTLGHPGRWNKKDDVKDVTIKGAYVIVKSEQTNSIKQGQSNGMID